MSAFTESVVEQAALAWFEALGYAIVGGPSLGPGEPGEERRGYADVVLVGRLRDALARLNPSVSREGLDEAFRKLTRISSPQPVDANRELHQYLVNGVSVEYLRADGTIGYDPVRLVDFDAPENNDWLVVNQLTIVEGGHNRRPDVVRSRQNLVHARSFADLLEKCDATRIAPSKPRK
jgi:type I restriction enzyme R subunit